MAIKRYAINDEMGCTEDKYGDFVKYTDIIKYERLIRIILKTLDRFPEKGKFTLREMRDSLENQIWDPENKCGGLFGKALIENIIDHLIYEEWV